MHVYIKKKSAPRNDSGWVCKVADDADLECFEFYVLNGMWYGLFVGGVVEILCTNNTLDEPCEVLTECSELEDYLEHHRQQCEKRGRFIPYNELNDDEPF